MELTLKEKNKDIKKSKVCMKVPFRIHLLLCRKEELKKIISSASIPISDLSQLSKMTE